ncbi:unnamed protein product [Rhizophagus irregularis]|nr:unnamed protein product [Rhizophagus irregularis]
MEKPSFKPQRFIRPFGWASEVWKNQVSIRCSEERENSKIRSGGLPCSEERENSKIRSGRLPKNEKPKIRSGGLSKNENPKIKIRKFRRTKT